MVRWIAVGFGVLWTIMAIAITSGAPSHGPFAVAKIVFPLFGVLFILAALFVGKAKLPLPPREDLPSPPREPRARNLECPRCAATAGEADVSPSGEVKCRACGQWFSVYR